MKEAKNYIFVNIIGITFVVILIAIAYKTTLLWMYERYIGADSYYSHGFLIPFASLYFIYLQKERIKQVEQKGSIIGLPLILVALLLHILGTILYIFSLSGLSLFILIVGLSLFLFGEKISRVNWFPLVFLIFMFPLPEALISLAAFPLKMLAAKVGVWIVSAFGVPVFMEGFNINLPTGSLLVGNPCSGLRSMLAFLALGSITAYQASTTIIKKWVILFLAIPIALLANAIRIPILILVSLFYGLEAAAPDTLAHVGSGILIFILGMFAMYVSANVLQK